MKRIGKPRVQVDRFPLSDLPGSPYVLTIICASLYDEKPDVRAIVRALHDASQLVEQTEGKANAAPYMGE